jgi:NitT/TauT family transport system substrate-binding protein
MDMMKLKHFFTLFCVVMLSKVIAAEPTTIKIGVQAGGTVEWELSALPASTDFKIETLAVANAEAGKIALQSGAVDMIVSDWLWVANMRSQDTDFTFYPYSSTAGALVVPKDSPIQSVKDLNGKHLGIAGGELDKNWLLLQALAQKDGVDLNKTVEKTFGAPPLITEQLKQNRVDAALTYWHFAAKLEAAGFKQIIDGRGILKGLGINENIPNLGYVFKADWGNQHSKTLTDFFTASLQAKKTLCNDDSAWQKVIPLTKADDAATQKLLRQRYCEGSIESWGEKEQTAAAKVFSLLKDLSKEQLTGNAENFPVGTFWTGK